MRWSSNQILLLHACPYKLCVVFAIIAGTTNSGRVHQRLSLSRFARIVGGDGWCCRSTRSPSGGFTARLALDAALAVAGGGRLVANLRQKKNTNGVSAECEAGEIKCIRTLVNAHTDERVPNKRAFRATISGEQHTTRHDTTHAHTNIWPTHMCVVCCNSATDVVGMEHTHWTLYNCATTTTTIRLLHTHSHTCLRPVVCRNNLYSMQY